MNKYYFSHLITLHSVFMVLQMYALPNDDTSEPFILKQSTDTRKYWQGEIREYEKTREQNEKTSKQTITIYDGFMEFEMKGEHGYGASFTNEMLNFVKIVHNNPLQNTRTILIRRNATVVDYIRAGIQGSDYQERLEKKLPTEILFKHDYRYKVQFKTAALLARCLQGDACQNEDQQKMEKKLKDVLQEFDAWKLETRNVSKSKL